MQMGWDEGERMVQPTFNCYLCFKVVHCFESEGVSGFNVVCVQFSPRSEGIYVSFHRLQTCMWQKPDA